MNYGVKPAHQYYDAGGGSTSHEDGKPALVEVDLTTKACHLGVTPGVLPVERTNEDDKRENRAVVRGERRPGWSGRGGESQSPCRDAAIDRDNDESRQGCRASAPRWCNDVDPPLSWENEENVTAVKASSTDGTSVSPFPSTMQFDGSGSIERPSDARLFSAFSDPMDSTFKTTNYSVPSHKQRPPTSPLWRRRLSSLLGGKGSKDDPLLVDDLDYLADDDVIMHKAELIRESSSQILEVVSLVVVQYRCMHCHMVFKEELPALLSSYFTLDDWNELRTKVDSIGRRCTWNPFRSWLIRGSLIGLVLFLACVVLELSEGHFDLMAGELFSFIVLLFLCLIFLFLGKREEDRRKELMFREMDEVCRSCTQKYLEKYGLSVMFGYMGYEDDDNDEEQDEIIAELIFYYVDTPPP